MIEPEQAETVRRIFRVYAEGKSYKTIRPSLQLSLKFILFQLVWHVAATLLGAWTYREP